MSVASLLPAVLVIVVLLWLFTRFYLRGEDLSRYDSAPGSLMKPVHIEPSEAHHDIVDMLNDMHANRPAVSGKERLHAMRASAEQWSEDTPLEGLQIQAVDAGGVPAEWVLAEDADPGRRLLYIHGGGFFVGSPLSHRAITTRLARSHRTSVLAIDYRLLPEHKRRDCLADCQTAYRWILDNGPQGPAPVETFFVAGDSAGGNLAMAVTAWARDEGLQAANGCIALAPSTDGTSSGRTIRANLLTDPFLGPSLGKLMAMPNWVMLWGTFLFFRQRPCDPRWSPVHGDLSNLPPTLVHASEAEMLLDDSRRYVNKATSCGSEASLEVWPHMVHVWHLFHDKMPEAEEAFHHIEKFMALNTSSNT